VLPQAAALVTQRAIGTVTTPAQKLRALVWANLQ
jgi:hypothetical protein